MNGRHPKDYFEPDHWPLTDRPCGHVIGREKSVYDVPCKWYFSSVVDDEGAVLNRLLNREGE